MTRDKSFMSLWRLILCLALLQRVLKAALRGPRTNRLAAPGSAADAVGELGDQDYFSLAAGKEPGSHDAWPTMLKVLDSSCSWSLDGEVMSAFSYRCSVCSSYPYCRL